MAEVEGPVINGVAELRVEMPARLYQLLQEAAAMQRWSAGWKDRGSRKEENRHRNGGVGGGEGVRGDKSGDGGTWWEQQTGLSEHAECPPLLRSQLAGLLTDVLQRTDWQDRGGI